MNTSAAVTLFEITPQVLEENLQGFFRIIITASVKIGASGMGLEVESTRLLICPTYSVVIFIFFTIRTVINWP